MADKKLLLRLEAENTKLLKKLDQGEKKIERFRKQVETQNKKVSKSFKGVGTGIQAAIGVLASGAAVGAVVNATKKQQAALTQLRQGLESTDGAVGQTFDELVKKAEEFQRVSIFGDEQIIQAQSQLLTFTKVTGREFDKTIELAADLSVRMGQDLRSSVLQLGKALNDPVANLGALGRAGVQFSKDQKEVIKALFESGETAKAQQLILKELEVQFGGSARAARNDLGGALKALDNAFGDLLEANSLGGVTNEINELTATLQDPATIQAANALASGIVKGFSAAAKAIATTINVVQFLGEEISATFNGIANDDIVRLVQSLEKVQGLLSDESLFGKLNRVRFFGPGGVVEYWDKDELMAEQARLEKAIESARQSATKRFEGREAIDLPQISIPETQLPQSETVEKLKADLDRAADAQSTYNAALERGKQLTLEARTPVEVLRDRLQELNQLNQAGYISDETFERLKTKFSEVSEKTEEITSEMSVFADQAARNMQDSLADFFFDPAESGLKGLLSSFGDTLRRMAAEAAAAKIFESIGFGGGGGGIFDAFAGFFDKGGFIPSGGFGIAGERGPEIVTGPARIIGREATSSMMGSPNINITLNGSQDDRQAKRSAGLVAREVSKAVASSGRYS